jgi:hypothetical protein
VYHLWKQRNDLKHGNTPKSLEAIIARIRWEIRARIMAKGRFKESDANLEICQMWNLSRKIFGVI